LVERDRESSAQTDPGLLGDYVRVTLGLPPLTVSGVYEIAAPDGPLNLRCTTAVSLGANDDPLGSAVRYGLPIGA
jgi:hypothetical protein